MTYQNIEELKEIGYGKKIRLYTTIYLIQGWQYKMVQKYNKPTRTVDKKFIRMIKESDNSLVVTDYPLRIHNIKENMCILEDI